MHMLIDETATIKYGHDIATVIEDMIKEKFSIDATIHIEPLVE
jgi:divalent metal cation (Fe/Co/Zn/Cd) transporter